MTVNAWAAWSWRWAAIRRRSARSTSWAARRRWALATASAAHSANTCIARRSPSSNGPRGCLRMAQSVPTFSPFALRVTEAHQSTLANSLQAEHVPCLCTTCPLSNWRIVPSAGCVYCRQACPLSSSSICCTLDERGSLIHTEAQSASSSAAAWSMILARAAAKSTSANSLRPCVDAFRSLSWPWAISSAQGATAWSTVKSAPALREGSGSSIYCKAPAAALICKAIFINVGSSDWARTRSAQFYDFFCNMHLTVS